MTITPKQMRAAQVMQFGKTEYEINNIDVPKPKGWECLIKIGAAGYCHTDSMVAHGDYASIGSACPITGSHEPVGTIVAMGEEALQLDKYKIGDRVGSYCLKGACGKCADCTVFKDATYCTSAEGFIGLTLNGGFGDYCLVDARATASIPDKMSFVQAAPLMCAGITIYKAIRRAEQAGLQPGGTVGFSGLGALGHLGVQFAKTMGYKTVGIDNRNEPIDLARSLKFPPDLCIDASKVSAEEVLKDVIALDPHKPFQGLDAAILLADPQDSFDYAISLLARHGTLVLISQPADGITIQFMDLIFRDIRLVSSLLGTAQELQETIDLCAKHGIESSLSIYDLDHLNQLVHDSHSEHKKGKSVVSFA